MNYSPADRDELLDRNTAAEGFDFDVRVTIVHIELKMFASSLPLDVRTIGTVNPAGICL